jgi:hypothetical protein
MRLMWLLIRSVYSQSAPTAKAALTASAALSTTLCGAHTRCELLQGMQGIDAIVQDGKDKVTKVRHASSTAQLLLLAPVHANQTRMDRIHAEQQSIPSGSSSMSTRLFVYVHCPPKAPCCD